MTSSPKNKFAKKGRKAGPNLHTLLRYLNFIAKSKKNGRNALSRTYIFKSDIFPFSPFGSMCSEEKRKGAIITMEKFEGLSPLVRTKLLLS